MKISFNAESVSIEAARGNEVSLSIEANAREVAEALDLDDRLYDLCPVDVAGEIGHEKLLDAIGEQDIRAWVLENVSHDDLLESIGVVAICKFLDIEG